MAMEQGEIGWFSPDPRGSYLLIHFIKPKAQTCSFLRKVRNKINSSFSEVIDGCAEREETWIDETVRESYITLSSGGYAHSVETWFKGS